MIIRNGKTIHIMGRNISYIMIENEDRDLLHFYFGKKISDCDYSQMTDQWVEWGGYATNKFPLDVYPQEYPSYGYSDLRNGAYEIINKNGTAVSKLSVKEFKIHNGMTAEIIGMPCLFKGDNNADTLEVVLEDKAIDFEVHLCYNNI